MPKSQPGLITVALVVLFLAGCNRAPEPPKVDPPNVKPVVTPAERKPIEHWIGRLKDPDRGVREEAVRELGKYGPDGKAAINPLIAAMFNTDQAFRDQIWNTLARIDPDRKQEIAAFLDVLRSDRAGDVEIALNVIKLYGKLAVPGLVKLLDDPLPAARARAARALNRIGPAGQDAMPKLVANLKDADAEVRARSAEALMVLDISKRDDLIPTFVDLLDKSPGGDMGFAAGTCLVKLGPACAEPVLRVLKKQSWSGSNWQSTPQPFKVIQGLGPQALPAVTKALTDKDRELRLTAVRVLRLSGPAAKPALPALIDRLKDADVEIAVETMHALRELGPTAAAAVKPLMEIAAKDEKRLRVAACYALGKLGPAAKPAIPVLVDNLRHADRDVRWSAFDALGHFGADAAEAVPELMNIYKNPKFDGEHRRHAGSALARIDLKVALPLLIEGLKGEFKDERGDGVADTYLLGKLGTPAIKPVAELLESPVRNHRIAAVVTFRIMGPAGKEILPALEKRLQDDDEFVRLEATLAVASVGRDAKMIGPLLKVIQDEKLNEFTRAFAAEIFGDYAAGDAAALKLAKEQVWFLNFRYRDDAKTPVRVRQALAQSIQRIEAAARK